MILDDKVIKGLVALERDMDSGLQPYVMLRRSSLVCPPGDHG